MQKITPAIVLDGHVKSALSIVRSLGQKNIPVYVGSERKTAMALHSKYVSGKFMYPSPYNERDAFVRTIKAEAVRLGGKPVIYACSDATLLLLYEARESLEAYVTLVFPEERSMEIVFDKGGTYSLARVSSVPTITTHLMETREEVERLAKDLVYPVVVKPRHSVIWKDGKGIFGSAQFVHTPEELLVAFSNSREKTGVAPLIQPYVEGEEYGVEMLAEEGRPYAMVTHHRLRSLSPTGGASVLKETIENGEVRKQLEENATILVEKLSWTGPIMVEFKIDSDSREPLLMEINGRFWGSLPLSVFSGVDMPYLYYRAVTLNEISKEIVRGKERIVSNHFLGSALHLMRVLFARDKMRARAYPKRLQALKDFFRTPKGTFADVWSLRDPKPAFFEIIDILNKMWHSSKQK
jgi:predicted ATP-grasp superfamily ATP-dependent carboligase